MAWIRNRPVGLVYRDPGRSQAGYTLLCSVRGSTAWLLDPDGRFVHRWHHPEGIQHAKLLGDGKRIAGGHQGDIHNLIVQKARPNRDQGQKSFTISQHP